MSLKYKHTLLFVDDEASITNALQRVFRNEGYEIHTASSGGEGLDRLSEAEKPFSLIISDQRMSGMTGAQFLGEVRKIFPDTMRILLTGHSDMDAIVDAVNKGGIYRYLTKPWNEKDILFQVRQALEQYELVAENHRLLGLTKRQNEELTELNKNLEEKVKDKTREISKRAEELRQSYVKLQGSFESTIQAMSTIVETRDPYTYGHQKQVSLIACAIAEEMGLSKDQISGIRMASIVHDVGKISIPSEILNKPGKLNKFEFELIKMHSETGYNILKTIEFPFPVAQIVLQHHERMDGSGYPGGISGRDILLEARIIGVADVVDAMASHRPYRPALGINEALEEISRNRGILYDFMVVDACLELFSKKKFGQTREEVHVLEI